MPRERYVSRSEIAELLGVDERTITNWIKKHPEFAALTRVSGKARTFPVQKVLRWNTDRAVADAVASLEPPAPDDKEEADLRRAIADAEFAEIKVKKLRADLVDAAVVAREVNRAHERVAARLKSVPGEYAPQILTSLTMAEATMILRRIVAATLSAIQVDFMDDDQDEPPDPGHDEPMEGAA